MAETDDPPSSTIVRPGVSPAALVASYGAVAVAAPSAGGGFGRPPAPLRSRAVAAAIDGATVLVPTGVVGLVAYLAIYRPACRSYEFLGGTRLDCSGAGGAAVWSWLAVGLVFVVAVTLVEVVPIVRRGATWGMRSRGLVLIDAGGSTPRWPRAALRSLLRWTVSLEPLAMGHWWAAVDRRRLTWHDLILETSVVSGEPLGPEGPRPVGIDAGGR